MKKSTSTKFGRKGIATWIAQMAVGLFSIGVVAFFYFLLFGRYFDIHSVIMSNEAKRHVINMAQVMLSSDKLVYEEEIGGMKRFYRGVFDRAKLDEQLMTDKYDKKESEIREEISYPNTGTQIIVYDVELEKSWTLSFGGPGSEITTQFLECMLENIDRNIFSWVFNNPLQPSPWNFWDIYECAGTYGTKIGIFEKDFPVLINDNGALHAGRLYIRLMEL